MSFAGATQYPLHDPFLWLPPPDWMGMSLTGLGLAGTESESPHLAYICGLRSFGFWLMASSSSTKAGLFRRLRAFLLRSALAPVTTAGAAFHRRGLNPARPVDREEMSTAHSMGKPSSNSPFQLPLSRTSNKTVMSMYFLHVHPTLI